MSALKGIKDVSISNGIIKYIFEDGYILPEIGKEYLVNGIKILIVDTNEEENSVKVAVVESGSYIKIAREAENSLNLIMEDISKMIYKETSEGMTALIGWDNLPEDTKFIYKELCEDIIKLLKSKNLIKYLS